MRLRSLVAVAVLLAGLPFLLLACSGPAAPTAPGTPGGSYAPVSEPERTDALGAVERELAALLQAAPETYQAPLATFIETIPVFAWASVQENGGVLAFFTDGRGLFVPPARMRAAAPSATAAATTFSVPNGVASTNAREAAGFEPSWAGFVATAPIATQSSAVELPASNRAVLIEAMGSAHASALGGVAASLRHAGYDTQILPGDVASLRALPTAGVLYYSGHGGEFMKADVVVSDASLRAGEAMAGRMQAAPRGIVRPPIEPAEPIAAYDDFALWTAEPRTTDADAAHADDLDAGRLVYLTQGFDADRGPQTHYAITTSFIEAYWQGRLSEHSLAFIDACFGGSSILGAALAVAGASAQAGWDAVVSDMGTVLRLTPYFFDRGTGRNAFEATNPPNPPFETPKVLEALAAKGYDRDPAFPAARFAVTMLQGANVMLTPRAMLTIDNFHQGGDYVYVLGQFGSAPGTVTVDGVPVAVTQWTPTSVYLDFESSRSGDVVVEVGGRRSNARRLTSWTVPLDIENRGEGTLALRMDCTLHLRADLLPWNPWYPDYPTYLSDMAKPYVSVTGKETSSCTYEASGSWTSPDPNPTTISFSGGGTMAKDTAGTGLPDLTDAMVVDPGHVSGILSASFPSGRHFFTRTVNGSDFAEDLAEVMGGDCNGLGFESLQLDPQRGIRTGTETFVREGGGSCTASWSAATAVHPPNE